MKTILENQIIKTLRKIPDPELGISIWDLGLIYDIQIKEGKVLILMTLTSVGCPLFEYIEESVKKEIKKIKEVKSVTINLTFEPAWTIEKMSKKAQAKLGFN